MPLVSEAEIKSFAVKSLAASGLAPEDAEATATGLVEATKRGVTTHGVFRLPQYSESVLAGKITAKPDVKVLSRRGCTALVNAGGGYGFRPTQLAAEIGIEIAREHGVAVVGVRNSHHFGAAAIYTTQIAKAGMIGLATTTTKARIAPTGAMGPVVGNNPISVAIPRRSPAKPIVLDMALSQVAMGRIRIASKVGKPVPEGWGYDSQGRPTTNADAILYGGLLAAIGEHKGYGLSVVVEVLAGVLTGSPFGLTSDNHDHKGGGVGHFVLVVAPDFLRETDAFYDDVEELVRQIKASAVVEGGAAPMLPGEIEDRKAAEADRDGLPISDDLADQLKALAATLKIDAPRYLP